MEALIKEIANLCEVSHGTAPTVLRRAVPNPEAYLGENDSLLRRMMTDPVLRKRIGVFVNQQLDELKFPLPEILAARGNDGISTLVLRGAQRIEGPIREVCQQLAAADTGHDWVTVHSVITKSPANNQGLGVHWDLNPVPALQVHGSKTWYFFEPVVGADELNDPWSLRGFTAEEQSRLTPEHAILKVTLEPGDMLVAGAGLPHFCVGGSEGSTHISFGPLRAAVYEKYGNEDHLL